MANAAGLQRVCVPRGARCGPSGTATAINTPPSGGDRAHAGHHRVPGPRRRRARAAHTGTRCRAPARRRAHRAPSRALAHTSRRRSSCRPGRCRRGRRRWQSAAPAASTARVGNHTVATPARHPSSEQTRKTRRGEKRSATASSANTSVPAMKPSCTAAVSQPTAAGRQRRVALQIGHHRIDREPQRRAGELRQRDRRQDAARHGRGVLGSGRHRGSHTRRRECTRAAAPVFTAARAGAAVR